MLMIDPILTDIYDIVLIVFFHRHLQTGATQLYTYIITNVYLLSRWHL